MKTAWIRANEVYELVNTREPRMFLADLVRDIQLEAYREGALLALEELTKFLCSTWPEHKEDLTIAFDKSKENIKTVTKLPYDD